MPKSTENANFDSNVSKQIGGKFARHARFQSQILYDKLHMEQLFSFLSLYSLNNLLQLNNFPYLSTFYHIEIVFSYLPQVLLTFKTFKAALILEAVDLCSLKRELCALSEESPNIYTPCYFYCLRAYCPVTTTTTN